MRVSSSTEFWLIVLAAFVPRLAVIFLFPYTTVAEYSVILGGPIGDPTHWHQVGADVAEGFGITTSLRPLYSLLLALPMPFFGPDFAAGKIVNALLDTSTIAFAYLIFRRIFPRPAPLIIALTLAAFPKYVLFSHAFLTEHAGASFALATLAAFLAQPPSVRSWALAGVMTALSNLARPLSLFAIGFPIIASLAFDRASYLKRVLAFALATFVVLSPWMWSQYQRYGILSVSSNSMEALYAATSPRYGQWTPNVISNKLTELGRFDLSVGEIYEVFRRGVFDNLRENPVFWGQNTLRRIWQSVNYGGLWYQQGTAIIVGTALLWILCGALMAWRGTGVPVWYALASSAMLIASWLLGSNVLIPAAGFVFAATFALRPAVITGFYLFGLIFAHSIFGFSSTLDRLELMYAPLVVGFQAAAFMSVGYCATALATRRPAARPAEGSPAIAFSRIAAGILLVLVLLGSGRLAARYLADPPHRRGVKPDYAQAMLAAYRQQQPNAERAVRRAFVGATFKLPMNYVPVPADLSDKLGVQGGAFVFYIVYDNLEAHWTLVPIPEVKSLLGKQFVAVVEQDAIKTYPIHDLIYVGPLSRIRAMAPITESGPDLEKALALR